MSRRFVVILSLHEFALSPLSLNYSVSVDIQCNSNEEAIELWEKIMILIGKVSNMEVH
jgi:hypothetical protein